jgi:hypothetical protein
LGAREIFPKQNEVDRASLPMWTWDAAFYGMTARDHTEKVLLRKILDWASGYRTFNQGQNPIWKKNRSAAAQVLQAGGLEEVYISWSNDGLRPGDTARTNTRFKNI